MNQRANQGQKGGQKGQQQGQRRKKKRNRKKQDPAVFWGDHEKLPVVERFETETPEPLAVVHSLGRAPVPGVLAEPYFAAVYDRAAFLAQALSDAAGLDDMTPIERDEDVDANVADGVDADGVDVNEVADEADDDDDEDSGEADAADSDEVDDSEEGSVVDLAESEA